MTWKIRIFDWDGTLVDTSDMAYKAAGAIFENFQLEAPPKQFFLENITSDFLPFYHKQGIPSRVTRKELNEIWQQYFYNPEHSDRLSLREGAKEALSSSKESGAKIVILSGSPRTVIEDGLKKLGISHLIDHIEGDARGKINELGYVLKQFSADKKTMMYVDDTYEGLTAAKSFGITAIGIMGGFNPKHRLLEANPDYLISDLRELIRLFK